MKWLGPALLLTLLPLTAPDGATLWFSPDDVGPFRLGAGSGTGCKWTTIYTGGSDQIFCVKETPEKLKQMLDAVEPKEKKKK